MTFCIICEFLEHAKKPLLANNVKLHEIIEDVKSYLGDPPSVESLPDGSVPNVCINRTLKM